MVERFDATSGGVLVTGVFNGEQATLFFPVEGGPSGIVTVGQPEMLQTHGWTPGGSEQKVMRTIRQFFEVSTEAGELESYG